MFLKSSEDFEWPQFPKLPLLRRQNFLKVFLPVRSVGFCLRAWPLGPRLPEATHRCFWQPRTATLRSSSGSSRPRRKWMRRPTTAVASDEGFGDGKPSWGNGIFTWGSEWNVDGSSCFRCLAILWKVFCQNIWYWDFVFLFFILTVLFLHLGFSSFNGKFAEAFAATFGVFFVSMLSAVTILMWQYFGATITIQNWSHISGTVQCTLTSWLLPTL